jgi:AraC-like DNA-binding protein
MFYLSGIAITFFLLFLLFAKKGKTAADVILASWLIVIGVHLLLYYLYFSDTIFSYPWLLGIHFPLPLFHGPLLYLYAAVLTGKINLSNKKHLLHFVPALVSYVYLIRFFLLPAEEKITVFQNKGAGYETFMFLNSGAIIISGIVYSALTIILHRVHRRNILNQFSYTEKINLDWIQYLMYGIALIWVFVIIGNDNFVFGAAVLFVLFMGFFGIRQVGIFTPDNNPQNGDVGNPPVEASVSINDNSAEMIPANDAEESGTNETGNVFISAIEVIRNSNNEPKRKYSRSGLTKEASEELHKKLNHIIHSEKIFNEGELTLTELAKRLGTHPNYLSQVINEKEGKNFYDYINTLRTEEFIKVVSSPDSHKFTLLSLAFECGFNSKSSFNKYFKKVTGQAPSEYLQRMNIKEVA